MTGRRVVVTGIGTINPLGNSIEEYFSNLEKGVCAQVVGEACFGDYLRLLDTQFVDDDLDNF